MLKSAVIVLILAGTAGAACAQSYVAPSPTGVPTTATRGLSKADRKLACTGAADRRGLHGLTRQQFRAACRGRPIPRSVH